MGSNCNECHVCATRGVLAHPLALPQSTSTARSRFRSKPFGDSMSLWKHDSICRNDSQWSEWEDLGIVRSASKKQLRLAFSDRGVLRGSTVVTDGAIYDLANSHGLHSLMLSS